MLGLLLYNYFKVVNTSLKQHIGLFTTTLLQKAIYYLLYCSYIVSAIIKNIVSTLCLLLFMNDCFSIGSVIFNHYNMNKA